MHVALADSSATPRCCMPWNEPPTKDIASQGGGLILLEVADVDERKHDRFGSAGFLAAHNAGPGRYEAYLARIRPLPEEAHNYVAALAPTIGAPTLPRSPESTPFPSPSPTFVAARGNAARSITPNRNIFSPKMSPFENRPGMNARMLFSAVRVAFEPTSAGARVVDMTALEPSGNRAMPAIFVSGNNLPGRSSRTAQLSLSSNGNALFAVQQCTWASEVQHECAVDFIAS